MLNITTKPIAQGSERKVFIHPTDPTKLIKISINPQNTTFETDLEIKYFKQLKKQKNLDWSHIPKFYGEIMTNKGRGFITEAIRDYNGNISKNMRQLLQENGLEPYKNHFVEFKKYCLDQKIIFNTGMASLLTPIHSDTQPIFTRTVCQ